MITSANLICTGLATAAFLNVVLSPLFSADNELLHSILFLGDIDALVREAMSSSMAPKPGCSVKMIRRKSISHRMMEIVGRYER